MSGAFILPVKNRYLCLDKVTDPHFCHDGDGNGLDDLLDHMGVALERGNAQQAYIFSTIDGRRASLALAIRATPPSERISAGTRSSAMTAHAPASSAIRALA
jgi:hypothetical protein